MLRRAMRQKTQLAIGTERGQFVFSIVRNIALLYHGQGLIQRAHHSTSSGQTQYQRAYSLAAQLIPPLSRSVLSHDVAL